MLKILHLAGAAGILGLFAIPAQAQQAKPAQCDVECTCWTPLLSNPVGAVGSFVGYVQASTDTGIRQVGFGTPLNLPSQLITGQASTAGIVVGQCKINVPQNTEVTITQQCGQVCVQVSQSAVAPVVAGGEALPLVILATGAAVAAGILLLDDDDEGGGGGGRPASN